jgi:acetyltransferase-like isoleucine patch superfamily enzyme
VSLDRYHAYGTGPTYPIAAERSDRFVSRAWKRFLSKLWYVVEREQARMAVASFQDNAVVGNDCRVGPRAWCVNPGPREHIQLGESVICRGVLRTFNSGTLIVGDYVYIGDDCLISCSELVEIGSWTMISHSVQIIDSDSHPSDPILREQDYLTILGRHSGPRPPIPSNPVLIGERVQIGTNAIVMKGVHIGEGSIIAPGAFVTANVAPGTVVAGNPARFVMRLAPVSQPPSAQTDPELCDNT